MPPLTILHQDPHLIAVHKPAGLLMHPSPIDRHETRFLIRQLTQQTGRRLHPIHRLDKPTSGIVLLAFDPHTAAALAQQFATQHIQKTYWAIVRGWTAPQGHIDHPVAAPPDRYADPSEALPKPAQTDYHTLAHSELPFISNPRHPTSRYSWVSVQPHTGRRHQIRRHFKHIFHPILGDTTHGDLKQNHAIAAQLGQPIRLMLHAHSLHFIHPHSQTPLTLTAPTDSTWHTIATALNFQAE